MQQFLSGMEGADAVAGDVEVAAGGEDDPVAGAGDLLAGGGGDLDEAALIDAKRALPQPHLQHLPVAGVTGGGHPQGGAMVEGGGLGGTHDLESTLSGRTERALSRWTRP